MLRNLSWALLILNDLSLFELISLRMSFCTLFTTPSDRCLFLAKIRRPLHGLGLAVIRLPSIRKLFFSRGSPRRSKYKPEKIRARRNPTGAESGSTAQYARNPRNPQTLVRAGGTVTRSAREEKRRRGEGLEI